VALVRIYNAGLKCAAHGSLEMQDPKKSPKIAILAPSHNFVGPYLRNQGTYRQSEKNLLSSNMSSRCPHNMVIIGPLTAEIAWRVWGTPSYLGGYRVLAALLHGSQVVGVSQTAALNRGRHLCSAGRPSRWTLAHILVVITFRVSRRRREMYCGQARLCLSVCLSAAACPHYCTDLDVTWGSGR